MTDHVSRAINAIQDEIKGSVNNLISPFLNVGNQLLGTLLPDLGVEKTSPNNLAEEIENMTDVGAVLMVYSKDPGEVTHRSNKFFLHSLNFTYKEKAQLNETFDSPAISFFGDSIRIYNFAGTAIDYASESGRAWEHFHQSSLIKMYDDILRGTKLVQNNSIAIMKIMNHTIWGYPLNFRGGYNAAQDKVASFSMSWIVLKHTLTFPSIVTDDNLKTLYTTVDASVDQAYLNNINSVLDKTNKLLILKEYDVSLESLPDLDHIPSASLQNHLEDLTSLNFYAKVSENIKALQDDYKNKLSAGISNVSAVLSTQFPGGWDQIDSFFQDLGKYSTGAFSTATIDENEFLNFQLSLLTILEIKNRLTTFKIQNLLS